MNNRVAEEFRSIDLLFDLEVCSSEKCIFASSSRREVLAASFFLCPPPRPPRRTSEAELSWPESLAHDMLLAQSDMIPMSSLFITSFLLHQEEANVNY